MFAASIKHRTSIFSCNPCYLWIFLERGFAIIKDLPLSLTLIYLQCEDHITALIRLLSIGLRVLTLLEFQVRNLTKM